MALPPEPQVLALPLHSPKRAGRYRLRSPTRFARYLPRSTERSLRCRQQGPECFL